MPAEGVQRDYLIYVYTAKYDHTKVNDTSVPIHNYLLFGEESIYDLFS